MLISPVSPLRQFQQIFQLNRVSSRSLPPAFHKGSISKASANEQQTIFPLAYWMKDGFHIFIRFDTSQEKPRVAVFRGDTQIEMPAHFDLSALKPITTSTLAQAQQALAQMTVNLQVKSGVIWVTPKLGLRGGMPPSPKRAWQSAEDTQVINTTSALVDCLRDAKVGDQHHKQLGLCCIKAFETGSKLPQDIAELAELARSSNPDIIRAVLAALLKPLQEKTLLDPMLLHGLARALEYADPKHLSHTDLVAILQYLKERIGKISEADEMRLANELSALSALLDAMVAADLSGLDRKMIHKSLMQTVGSLAGNGNPEIAHLAKSCEQALVRLPSDESKVHRYLRRALHAEEGISLLAQAWDQKSIGSAIGAFQEFYKAFKPDKRKSSWYDAVQFTKLLIGQGKYQEAGHILAEVSSKHKLEAEFLIGQYVHTLSRQEQAQAKDHLPRLSASSMQVLPSWGTALISAARTTLLWRLHELGEKRSARSEEEKLYIALDGRSDPHSKERLNLLEEAQSFLASGEQVLLIQGGSGAGKSMFLRTMERMLWQKRSEAQVPIPIHIRLGGVDPKSCDIIEDALHSMSFTEAQILELQTSRQFVFFLDGYDEMAEGQLVNLLEHGGLKRWACKVVIGCRSQHLASLDKWQRYFAPFKGDVPNFKALRMLYVVPFSDEQIHSYLTKYLAAYPISRWSPDRFVSVISQIKGLRDLIESPFILRMTSEVLPTLITEDVQAQDMTLTRRNLYDAFAGQWFERQEAKMHALGQDIPEEIAGNFKEACAHYCQGLAMAMVEARVVEATSPMTLFMEGDKPSLWEDFLGSDPVASVLRRSVPLTQTPSGYAFIHKSLLEHFASKATTAQLTGFRGPSTLPKFRDKTLTRYHSKSLEKQIAERYKTFDIESTWDLAQALQSQTLTPEERAVLHTLAVDTIESFSSHPLTSELIEELVPLAAIADAALVRRVLEQLIHPLGNDVMVDDRLVTALSRAVALVDTKSVDPSHLLACVDVLHKRLSKLHKTKADRAIIDQLNALEHLTCALVDSGVVVDDGKLKALLETLKGISSKNLQLITARKSLKQALLRLDTNEDRLSIWMERGQYIGTGISALMEGVGSYSPKKILEGLIAFREAVKTKGKKHTWYDDVRAASLLVRSGDILAYQELKLFPKEPHAQLALIRALNQGVRQTADEQTRSAWIAEIVSAAARGDDQVQASVLSLLESYRIYDAPEVQRTIDGGLAQLQPLKGATVSYIWLDEAPLKAHASSNLLTARKSSISWHLAQLKAATLNDSSVLQESPFHVPLNAAYNVTDSVERHFPLDQGVRTFLDNADKRTLLLMGDSGSGKSLSMKLLCAELWRTHKKGDPIPLFISLTGIPRNSTTIIEDSLKRAGFNPKQIAKLKQNRSFVFVLDGYDEMNGSQNKNLIITNEMLLWPGKIILTCRTQYAQQMPGGYTKVFMPHTAEGKSQLALYDEVTTVPFTTAQIEQYLHKFCEQTDVSWTPDLYLEYINRIPKLREMIETPFVLRILTEVLPRIVAKHGTGNIESLKLTRVDFYEAFVRQWFERQFDKLIRGGHGNLSRNEVKGYYTYAVRLASQMHAAGLNEVTYEPLKRREVSAHPFAPFFASAPPELVRARTACPLVVSREGNSITYRFLHKSVLEFLGGRAAFDGVALSAQGLADAMDRAASRNDKGLQLEELGVSSDGPDFAVKEVKIARRKDVADEGARIASSLLGQRLFTEDMGTLRFWVDDVDQKPGFREQLLAIVELSKTCPEVAIAAANAITLLVGAEHSFADADLRGIRVPGALLDRGNFSHADLRGADLRGCSLQEAFLNSANCAGAYLEETDWGQSAVLTKHEDWMRSRSNNITREELSNHLFYQTPDMADCLDFISHSCVGTLALSPDRNRFISGLNDMVAIWDKHDLNTSVSGLSGHSRGVLVATYSPDGARIASGSADKTVRVWDARRYGEALLVLKGHTGSVMAVTYSPDGARIASGSADKTVRVWDLVRGGEASFVLQGHTDSVMAVTYSPDSTRIASGSDDKTVRVWDARRGGEALLVLKGHADSIMAVLYSPDGSEIVSRSWGTRLVVWQSNKKIYLSAYCQEHTDSVTVIKFSPNERVIASGSEDRTVRVWDLVRGGEAISVLRGHTDSVRAIAYSPDGKRIASGSDDKTVRVWDLVRGGEASFVLQGHTAYVIAIAYSPDGKRIASGSVDKTVRVWDGARIGGALLVLKGHANRVMTIAYSPDGTRIASGSADGAVQVWDTARGGESLLALKGHKGSVMAIAYSPDGKRIASGSFYETTGFYGFESADGYETTGFSGFESADGALQVWDAFYGGEAILTSAIPNPIGCIRMGPRYSVEYSLHGGNGDLEKSSRSMRVWQMSVDGRESSLVWRSDRVLDSKNMNIEGACLGKENWQLLEQLEAVGTPQLALEGPNVLEENNEAVTLNPLTSQNVENEQVLWYETDQGNKGKCCVIS